MGTDRGRRRAFRSISRLALGLAILLVAGIPVWAHPHVFIQGSVGMISDGTTVTGVRLSWRFDDMFSASVLQDYVHSSTGFSAAAVRKLQTEEFDNLKDYHYFARVTVDGVAIKNLKVSDFQPAIDKGVLIYAFTIPVSLNPAKTNHEIRTIVFDDTFFVAFDEMKPELVFWMGSPVPGAKIDIRQRTIETDGWGKQPADEVVLTMGGGT